MTKIKALELSIELWQWLAENPAKEKNQHPTLPIENWYAECALCEIASNCWDCAMFGQWPTTNQKGAICNTKYPGNRESAYLQWYLARNQLDRGFFAQVLVESFQARLTQLEDKNETKNLPRVRKSPKPNPRKPTTGRSRV